MRSSAPGRGDGMAGSRSTARRPRRARCHAARRPSPFVLRPEGVLPAVEQLAAELLPIGQAKRHVAEVDENAAEAAGELDAEMPATATEPDWIAEVEPGDSPRPGREIDELDRPGDQLELVPGRLRSATAETVDHEPPGRPAGPEAGRHDEAAERSEEIVGQISNEAAALIRVLDRAERPEEPGMIPGHLGDPRTPNDVGNGERDRRPRRDGERTARRDEDVRDGPIGELGRAGDEAG